MLNNLLAAVSGFIVNTISTLGYPGVWLLMTIQSAAIPIPSEVIMPFAGFLVATGRFSLLAVALVGALGNILGASITYALGLYGGRPLVMRYGKYVLISESDVELADRFFAKYGNISVFFGRLLPVVNTFISIPAGVARVKFGKFLLYTFCGSFLWSLFLAFLGMKLGENWATLRDKLHGFETAIAIVIVLGIIFWVYRHWNHNRQT